MRDILLMLMTVNRVGSYASAIHWDTLTMVPTNTMIAPKTTPTASITEVARVQVNQMTAAFVVMASLDRNFTSIKIGSSEVVVQPLLGMSSWGFI
jgi:hypothetical protein